MSRAAPTTGPADLRAILATSRAYNRQADVTGLLLAGHGTFLQFLEGERDVVDSLYASICRDVRHTDVTTVRTRQEQARQFPGWRMGFADLDLRPGSVGSLAIVTGDEVDPLAPEIELVRDLLGLFDADPRAGSDPAGGPGGPSDM